MGVGIIAAGRRRTSGGVVADSNFSDVVLLLGGYDDGSGTVYDESEDHRTISKSGSAAVSSTQSKFGGTSLYIPGSSYVSTPVDNLNFGTSQFTIECWVYRTSNANASLIIGQRNEEASTFRTSFSLYVGTGRVLYFECEIGGVGITASGGTVSDNTWTHCAVDRDGTGKCRLYVNGSMVGSFTNSGGPYVRTEPVRIGNSFQGGWPFNGYIDELRYTLGVARYASDGGFTVPTQAYARSTTGAAPSFTTAATVANNAGFNPGAVGDTYTGTPGVHTGVTNAYQWLSDGVAISGATGLTYTATSGESAEVLGFRHTTGNSLGTVSSTATIGPIAASPTYSTQTVTFSDGSTVTLSDASNLEMYHRTA